jgi:uncharacterized membrane protein YkgB
VFIELFSSVLLAAILLACACGLMVWHLRAWRASKAQGLEQAEYDYRRLQFRRRMQTTAMLGLMAVALPIGLLVMQWWPKAGVFFWGGVLLLVVWVVLLALADVWATSLHYGRVQTNFTVEQAKLQAEVHRMQSLRRNGKAPRRGDHKGSSARDEGTDPT